jgi:hypothetical protein
MEEGLVHYYNVITGKCACGAAARREVKTFSVFPDKVNCPLCLKRIKAQEGKSEGKSG